MRAAVIHRLGGPEEFSVVDVPVPVPGPGQVLVEVVFAGVNPVDHKIRDGSNRMAKLLTEADFPLILGEECSGVVVAVGEGVEGLAEGDRVFGMGRSHGCYAEYVALGASTLATVAPDADLRPLGGLALAGQTAWAAVHDLGRVTASDTVLIHGGGGGVGQIMVQLAVRAGATVYATASGRHREHIEAWGAHHVDYATQDFTEVVPKPTAVIDGVYFGTYERSIGLLDAGDRLVVLPSLADLQPARDRGLQVAIPQLVPDSGRLAELARLVAAGELEIVVSQVLPLERVSEAHRIVEAGHTQGKVLLRL